MEDTGVKFSVSRLDSLKVREMLDKVKSAKDAKRKNRASRGNNVWKYTLKLYSLYVLFVYSDLLLDDIGEHIYVGITGDCNKRFKSHMRRKEFKVIEIVDLGSMDYKKAEFYEYLYTIKYMYYFGAKYVRGSEFIYDYSNTYSKLKNIGLRNLNKIYKKAKELLFEVKSETS